MSLLLVALLAAARVESVAVRPVDGRPGIVVVAHEPLAPVVVSRNGSRLLVRIPQARLSRAFAGPRHFVWRAKARGGRSALAPEALRVVPARDDVLLYLTLAPDVPFGVHQEGRVLRLAFGESEPSPARGRSLLVAAAPADTTPPSIPTVTSPLASPAPATGPQSPPAFAALRAPVVPLTVTVEEAGPKALVRIRGGAGLGDARVRREGGEVIVTFDVGAEAVPASPVAVPPIEEIHVEKVATLSVVHVKVAPEVPFEVSRVPGLLTLTFGEEAALDKIAPPPPAPVSGAADVRSLVSPEIYRGLFPATFGLEGDREAAAASDLAREGLQIGPVHLRPSILASYVDGEYTLLDTPEPTRDRYLQLEPRVSADMPLFGGEVTADYGVRLRFLSQFDEINSTSHLLNAGFEMPLGTRTMVRLHDHFSTGILEATEVDPGREYFFDLSRFRRNDVEVGARVEAGPRAFLDGALGYNDVRFDDPAGFFPYTATSARVGAGLTFGDNLRGGVYYTYDHLPAPALKPHVRSTANSIGVAFDGDFGALTRGEVRLDYRDQISPDAAPGGQSYRGLAGALSLSRQLSPSAQLTVMARRATDLSAFENNAFYVSTGGQAVFSFGLPWSLSANTGIGYQENQYKTIATEIGAPREDSILGWTVGLSRPVGTFAFVRADYRRDRRRSNLPQFNITTDGFLVQMGVGLFGTSVRR